MDERTLFFFPHLPPLGDDFQGEKPSSKIMKATHEVIMHKSVRFSSSILVNRVDSRLISFIFTFWTYNLHEKEQELKKNYPVTDTMEKKLDNPKISVGFEKIGIFLNDLRAKEVRMTKPFTHVIGRKSKDPKI